MSLSRAEWRAECKRQISARLAVGMESARAIREAHAFMKRVHGDEPLEPPKLPADEAGPDDPARINKLKAAALIAVALVKGDVMEFSWLKAFWKGLQAVLIAALSVGLVAFAEAAFSPIDSAPELEVMGVPGWAVVIVLLVVTALRNAIKFALTKLPKGK